MPSNQKQIIEQTKITYSPLGNTFEIQLKIKEKIKSMQKKEIGKQIIEYNDIAKNDFNIYRSGESLDKQK